MSKKQKLVKAIADAIDLAKKSEQTIEVRGSLVHLHRAIGSALQIEEEEEEEVLEVVKEEPEVKLEPEVEDAPKVSKRWKKKK